MDTKLFFNPVPEEFVSRAASPNSFYKNIHVNVDSMPSLKGMHIALIGLEEARGGDENCSNAANLVRKKLYRLKKGTGNYRIADLGNLRNGLTLEDTCMRIREVCHYLINNNILPILVGGTHDLDIGQFLAYESMDKMVNFINVDAFLDMEEDEKASNNHIEKILLHQPNYLFNYIHLAYQTYLIDHQSLVNLEKLYFEAYRIGLIHSNIGDMEPVIRDGDVLSFDMRAIRSGDAPGVTNAQPFGLTGEEACQLSWYAGMNEKMSSIGFYEYNPSCDDDNGKTASVVATMIWYFIEGYYHRKGEQHFRDNDYIKYVVSLPSTPETITFYKSQLSDKWWMEVPLPESARKYSRNFIVPCGYSDYKQAADGEVPDRYVNTHARFI